MWINKIGAISCNSRKADKSAMGAINRPLLLCQVLYGIMGRTPARGVSTFPIPTVESSLTEYYGYPDPFVNQHNRHRKV